MGGTRRGGPGAAELVRGPELTAARRWPQKMVFPNSRLRDVKALRGGRQEQPIKYGPFHSRGSFLQIVRATTAIENLGNK